MEIKQVKYMGTMKDARVATERTRIGLFAVQVIMPPLQPAAFFVFADDHEEAGEPWENLARLHLQGVRMDRHVAEAIFN